MLTEIPGSVYRYSHKNRVCTLKSKETFKSLKQAEYLYPHTSVLDIL